MSDQNVLRRFSFQECMELRRLPDHNTNPSVRRFHSVQPAWKPGNELPWDQMPNDPALGRPYSPAAFGGHVYAQAPLAAARAVEAEDESAAVKGKLGIHAIHGVFTSPGKTDRPFVYEVSDISTARSFYTRLTTVRQPAEPSSNPSGPFTAADAEAPLGDTAFSCLTTFKRPTEGPSDVQEEHSPQKRFASILETRAPDEWEPSPQVDIDFLRRIFPSKDQGSFPIVDLYKVDMTDYNKDKPVTERRELILYRLYKPLPKEDTNAHIVAHAYEADRNGLLMIGNHLGYGYSLGHTATLSFSFYVHVNADEAVMQGDGWWVQEVWWPRVTAGRAMMELRLWSPEGKHVASGYQDGIVLPAKKPKEAKM